MVPVAEFAGRRWDGTGVSWFAANGMYRHIPAEPAKIMGPHTTLPKLAPYHAAEGLEPLTSPRRLSLRRMCAHMSMCKHVHMHMCTDVWMVCLLDRLPVVGLFFLRLFPPRRVPERQEHLVPWYACMCACVHVCMCLCACFAQMQAWVYDDDTEEHILLKTTYQLWQLISYNNLSVITTDHLWQLISYNNWSVMTTDQL